MEVRGRSELPSPGIGIYFRIFRDGGGNYRWHIRDSSDARIIATSAPQRDLESVGYDIDLVTEYALHPVFKHPTDPVPDLDLPESDPETAPRNRRER